MYDFIATHEIYSKIIAELPETMDELNALGNTVAVEPEFIEVDTNSPKFADSLEGVPVFVVPGFRPERLKKLYKNLMYPTFEARLPETIDSVENVAKKLLEVNIMLNFLFVLKYISTFFSDFLCMLTSLSIFEWYS